MSDDISCSAALEQLWELIDNELCAEDSARVQEHIERCKRCYPQYDFDLAFRQMVATQCREQAPPELRRRIFMRLLEEGAT